MNLQRKVEINMKELHAKAEELFVEMAGIGGDGAKETRMRRAAFEIRREMLEIIAPVAGYNFYEKFNLKSACLKVFEDSGNRNAEFFNCKRIQRIEPGSAWRGCMHMLCPREDFSFENRSVMDQLYGDIWGNRLHRCPEGYDYGYYRKDSAKVEQCWGIFGQTGNLRQLRAGVLRNGYR